VGRCLDEDRHLRRVRTGKTTFVGAVSEIMPLRTEALVTNASAGMDGLEATPMRTPRQWKWTSAASPSVLNGPVNAREHPRNVRGVPR
jgi:hypothetical protein